LTIRMPNGTDLSATPASINKAIADMSLLPNGTLLPQWANFADQAAWPMPNVSYALAPTSTIDATRGKTVASFLRYAVHDGQKLLTCDDGYVPLPANLVANSLAIADQIPQSTPQSGSGSSAPPSDYGGLPPLPNLPSTTDTGPAGGVGSTCLTAASD